MQLPRGNILDVVYVILSNYSKQLRIKSLGTSSELKMRYHNPLFLFIGLYNENNWQRDANTYNIREIDNKTQSNLVIHKVQKQLLVLNRNLQPEIFTGIKQKYHSRIPHQINNSKGWYQNVQSGGNILNPC